MRFACPVFIQGALFWVLALSTIFTHENYREAPILFQEKGRIRNGSTPKKFFSSFFFRNEHSLRDFPFALG